MTDAPRPIIQLLFPMGGLGSRFAETGISTPKPLIEIDGTPMICKAVSSFARLFDTADIRTIFVVRKEHIDEHDLINKIKATGVPNPQFVTLDRNTGGAVETCMEAAPLVLPDHPIVVMDCDLYFQSVAYEQQLLNLEKEGKAGLLLYFDSSNKRYSYAKLEEGTNTVLRTAEKNPISRNALIGAYGFGTGKVFVAAGKELLEHPLNPETGFKEYYLSLLFNIVLREQPGAVVAVPVDEFHSFGTPEELELYRAGKKSYMTE